MAELMDSGPAFGSGRLATATGSLMARTDTLLVNDPRAGAAGFSGPLDLACGLLALDVLAGLAGTQDRRAGAAPAAPERKQATRNGLSDRPERASSSQRTGAMLVAMRVVLDREAARLGDSELEGKAAVDQVALIVRTLEKIDQMERLALEDQARAASQTLSAEERAKLRQTVHELILAAARRLAADGKQTETGLAVAGTEIVRSRAGDDAG